MMRTTTIGLVLAAICMVMIASCIKDPQPLKPKGTQLVRAVELPQPGPNARTTVTTSEYNERGLRTDLEIITTRYSGFNINDTVPGQSTVARLLEYNYDGELLVYRDESQTPTSFTTSCVPFNRDCYELRSRITFSDHDDRGNPRESVYTAYYSGDTSFTFSPVRYTYTENDRIKTITQPVVINLRDTITGEIIDRIATTRIDTYEYDENLNRKSRVVMYEDAQIQAQQGFTSTSTHDVTLRNPYYIEGQTGFYAQDPHLEKFSFTEYIVEAGLVVGIVNTSSGSKRYFEYE